MFWYTGKDKDGPSVSPDDPHGIVHVDHIDVRDAMSSEWPSKVKLHRSIGGVHFRGNLGPHQQMCGQHAQLLAKGALGWVFVVVPEQTLPFPYVVLVVVRFDPTAREPNAQTIRRARVWQDITIGGHDALDWTTHVLVRSVRIVSQMWLDSKRSYNAVGEQKQIWLA